MRMVRRPSAAELRTEAAVVRNAGLNRRLGTRERDPNHEGQNRHVATLNGTAATTRWLVAILETHQQADGSVVVPEALRPFVGLDVLEPVRR